jgi:2',3'-cyclic-nucleotide 2'-phosphodiesterase (5'-nucleotidase family)
VCVDGTLIAKCGQNLDYLGVVDLDISLDTSMNRTVQVNHSFQLINTDSMNIAPDEDVLRVIADFESGCGDQQSSDDSVLCMVKPSQSSEGGDDYSTADNLAVSLSTRSADIRSYEAAFPCYVACAMKWCFLDIGLACDFAIINGGFVRGDRLYPPGAPILHSHILQEMPFPRCPVLVKISGVELKLGLEQMLAGAHAPVGSFPHLSDGIWATYDLKAEPLDRVKEMWIDKDRTRPLEMTKEYLVAVSDFYCAMEGDGVTAFATVPIVSRYPDYTGTVSGRYFKTLDYLDGTPPGRLIPVQKDLFK